MALIGRNGGGKSTLLRTLAGLQAPLGGTMEVPEVALVLTEHEAMRETTVSDIVAMGRYRYTNWLGMLRRTDRLIVRRAIAEVLGSSEEEAEEMAKKRYAELSDGYKQKVLIAKALAQQTKAILLDEPTSHLDIPGRIQVFQLMQRLAHKEGKAVLMATHEIDLARKYADKILAVDDILQSC